MLRNASRRLLMHLFLAFAAALWWGEVALSTVTGDGELSVTGLVAGLAFVAIGASAGVPLWIAGAPRRAARLRLDLPVNSEPGTALLLGIMMTGLGASAGLEVATGSWWSWAFVVLGCAGGGLHFGLAFMMSAERQESPSSSIPTRQG
jgi:hypothetical protein